MKNNTLLYTILFFFASLSAVKAQTDSTRYDLGRVALSKKFTQSVTIKGPDLEKMPFSTLSEAINTWLYGVYGSQRTYVSVVDGNLNVDVNAYSIYDIDEITLVQNAATVLNGMSPGQVLLLIKTRRNHLGKSGITVAGQTNLVKLRSTNLKNSLGNPTTSNTTAYHQYYVSAYSNSSNVSAGISANLQHVAIPMAKENALVLNSPFKYDRFRFNAYLDAKLSTANTLGVTAGYAPQTDNADYGYSVAYPTGGGLNQQATLKGDQNLWHGDVKLQTNFGGGLVNQVNAGIQTYKLSANSHISSIQTGGYNAVVDINFDTTNTVNSFYIKDNLSYKIQAGKLTFEPNVNFTYKKVKDNTMNSYLYKSGSSISSSKANVYYNQPLSLLTPSLSITYADAILLQGGFQALLNKQPELFGNLAKPNKLLPFATLSVDVLQLTKANNTNTRWLIFGSFSKSMSSMTDLTGALTSFATTGNAPTGGGYNAGITYYSPYDPYRTRYQAQLGSTLSLLKNKIAFSYNYSAQQFSSAYLVYIPSPSSYYSTYYIYPEVRMNTHRIGVDINVVHTTNFSWVTGLNASYIKFKYGFTAGFNPVIPNTRIITGGFVNRLSYKHFFGAADILYRINEDVYTGYPTTIKGHNSIDLQNLYAGYKFSNPKFKNLQVFANARNLVQNNASTITNNQKFYGLGFKVGL